MWAFDLLRLEGEDPRLRPLEARREALMRLVDAVSVILFRKALAAKGAVERWEQPPLADWEVPRRDLRSGGLDIRMCWRGTGRRRKRTLTIAASAAC